MTKAQLVAQLLTKRFLAEGNLAAIPQKLGSRDDGMRLATARNKPDAWQQTHAFAGLSVQAVGYEEGKQDGGVVIYVNKAAVKKLKALPTDIDGVPISVRKAGLISLNPAHVGKFTNEPQINLREGRVTCGSSCATAGSEPGTFGAIVTRKVEGKDTLFLMSNNHVLAGCNHVPLGQPILTPSPDDARPEVYPPQSVAVLAEALPMYSGNPQHVKPCEADVALGQLVRPELVSSWQGGENGYDTPTEVADPESGMRVKKAGRTTGITIGIIDTLIAEPFPVNCQVRNFKGNVWFKGFWYVIAQGGSFALPGDSGSLVVTEDGKRAVGLLFSASPTGSFGQMLPIRSLLKNLGNAALVSGHGI